VGRRVPEWLKNQPWNVMSMDARRHMTMHHRMGVPRCVWYPRRPWCGAPTWVKFGVSNLGTGIANGFKRADVRKLA